MFVAILFLVILKEHLFAPCCFPCCCRSMTTKKARQRRRPITLNCGMLEALWEVPVVLKAPEQFSTILLTVRYQNH